MSLFLKSTKIVKGLFLALSIFLLGSCAAPRQTIISALADNGNYPEPGKCYFTLSFPDSTRADLKKESAFLWEIIPPKFKKVKKKYAVAALEAQGAEKDYYILPIRKAHLQLEPHQEKLASHVRLENPVGYLYCLVEVPVENRVFYKKDLKDDFITIEEKQIVEQSKLIKTYVQKQPKRLKANQYFFASSYWMEEKEVIAASSCPVVPVVKDIQKRLIDLGYKLVENNQMDEATKKALLDFQKQNGLNQGNLDIETLKKLKIDY